MTKTSVSILIVFLLAGSAPPGFADETARIRWGVDDAGTPGRLFTHPKGKEILAEFRFNFLVTHPILRPTRWQTRQDIRSMDQWCQEADIDWVANLESPNFRKEYIDDSGQSWFNRPDGRHFWLFPDELLKEFGMCERLWGFMYDEASHMQNCRNKIAGLDAPWIFDPEGHTLESAAKGFTDAVREIEELHARHGIRLSTEHVFPVLFHSFARAGWTAGTKILKENWSPAYLACALGAAFQYDTEFWVTPDLWCLGQYPGHSPNAYASALLLAYHMGADGIYTENLAYNGKGDGEGMGSLVKLTPDDYELTKHGKVAKRFANEYMPNTPRRYSFRDIKPRVAIIRQPDACWGQSDSWLPDMLFGHKEWRSNATTEAWLKIWHLLSRGVISEHSLSWHNTKLRRAQPYQLFAPLDGVVVYDHYVGKKHLEGVEVIFLTGLGLSDETQDAVRQSVAEGATCVALPDLLPEAVRQETGENGELRMGTGLWVATTDFLAPHVKKRVQHVIPENDEIRYRFGDRLVVFEPVGGDMNRLSVSVSGQRVGVGRALPASAHLAAQREIIDIHFHADARPENGGELPAVGAWMETHNVGKLIVMQYAQTLPRSEEEERQIIKNFAAYEGTLYRFCVLMPDDVSSKAEAVEWLEKQKKSGAIGFGEHYGKGLNFDDPANMRLYAACAEVGLPVLFHMDGRNNKDDADLSHLENALKTYPKCVFIGHGPGFWAKMKAADSLMSTYANLYADVSAGSGARAIGRDISYSREFMSRHSDRILFGTDGGPWSFDKPAPPQFELVESLDLPAEVKLKLCRTNAMTLFDLR